MVTIVGGYSQLSYGARFTDYEKVISKSLKPILTYMYNNPNFKFVLRLSIAEFEWIEKNNPGIFMLIRDLSVKGQLEILSSSYYDSILGMLPNSDRSFAIEKTTTYIRKKYSKRARGLWVDYQVFSPSIVPVMELSSLDYLVISRYNQLSKSSIQYKPFIMDETGKQTIVFPFEDDLSQLLSDGLKNSLKETKLKEEIKKLLKSNSAFYMLNLDELSKYENVGDYFNYIFGLILNNTTLLSSYVEDHSIAHYDYLSSGIYGKDYSIGKFLSLNQKIFDSPILSRHYFTINMLYDTVKSIKKGHEFKKILEELLMEARCSALYIFDGADSNLYRAYCSSKICEIEKILASINLLPSVIDSDLCITSKNIISVISSKGALISKLDFLSSNFCFTLNSELGLFYESFKDVYSSKVLNLSNKDFDLICTDSKKNEYCASIQKLELNKNVFSVKKLYKFKQNTIQLHYEIFNIGTNDIKDIQFETIFNISFDKNPEFNFDSNTVKSFNYSSRSKDFDFMCIFDSDSVLSSKPVIGNQAGYQYTQFRVQKVLSIKPSESVGFDIILKIDRYKEKNNDIKQ